MQIAVEDGGAVATVRLTGRLDIMGADVVATPLATLSGAKNGLIIDLSQVSFLASIGIRQLVLSAKAVARRGGKLVLLNPNETVTEVLETSGVSEMMPIMRDENEARAATAA